MTLVILLPGLLAAQAAAAGQPVTAMAAPRQATRLLSLLALLVGSSVCELSTGQARQNACAGEELNLHVTGSLNATGHPVVQARLEQPATSEPRRLAVRVRDEPCRPDGTVRRVMQAIVYGPRSGEQLPTPQRLQQQADPRLNELGDSVTSSSNLQVSPPDNSTTAPSVSTVAPDADSPRLYSGYSKVANVGRYKLHSQSASWAQAAWACAAEGATLAVPNSQREADALWQLKQSAAPPPPQEGGAQPRNFLGIAVMGLERMTYLVGVRRHPGAHNFTTIFGDELTDSGFSTWATEPSNEEHCGAMFSNTGLRAVSCDAQLSYICELPL